MDPDSNNLFSLLSTFQDTNGKSLLILVFVIIVLIALCAFFSACESAMIAFNDSKLRAMAEENKRARTVERLLKKPSEFLSVIKFGSTLCAVLAAIATALAFTAPIGDYFYSIFKTRQTLIYVIVLFIITLAISILTMIFADTVARKIAMNYPEKISLFNAPLLSFFYRILTPAVFIVSKTSRLILKIFRIDPDKKAEEVTEEEIMMMVDVGKENGVIEESQKDMIEGIFEFDDTTADEVMTHRTELVAVDIEDDINEVIGKMIEEGYSRIPVYEQDLDNIVGVVYVKDLLKFVGKKIPGDVKIADYMRKALYIPTSLKLREVFKKLSENKMQMAVVVDEYGGTAGILTMEDVLESIVGNMQDEYDDEEEEIAQLSENVFTIDGTAPVDEVKKELDIDIPDDSEYDTIGGFLTGLMERIPNEGEHPEVVFDFVKFTVLSVEDRRILSIRAEKLMRPESEEEQ